MKMTEVERQEYMKAFQELEGPDIDKVIRLQIQKALRETAKLVGLIQVGSEVFHIDSSEYQLIRTFGATFLGHVARCAGKLDIQFQ